MRATKLTSSCACKLLEKELAVAKATLATLNANEPALAGKPEKGPRPKELELMPSTNGTSSTAKDIENKSPVCGDLVCVSDS